MFIKNFLKVSLRCQQWIVSNRRFRFCLTLIFETQVYYFFLELLITPKFEKKFNTLAVLGMTKVCHTRKLTSTAERRSQASYIPLSTVSPILNKNLDLQSAVYSEMFRINADLSYNCLLELGAGFYTKSSFMMNRISHGMYS